jgi:hypothetical protein
MMSTFEVVTVFYNSNGVVQTKNYDLFSTKQQAVKHMNSQIKNKTYLAQRGKVKDGNVQLVDEHGKIREQLSLGEL